MAKASLADAWDNINWSVDTLQSYASPTWGLPYNQFNYGYDYFFKSGNILYSAWYDASLISGTSAVGARERVGITRIY